MIAICLAVIACSAQAQTNPLIAFTPNTQVVYSGSENPIILTLGNYKPNELQVKVSEGVIWKDTAKSVNRYIWKLCKARTDSVFLMVYCNKVLVKKFRYEVMRQPDPVPTFGVSHNSNVQISQVAGILLRTDDRPISVKFKMISYCVKFADSSHVPYQYYFNKGAMFTKAVKAKLKEMKANSYVTFYKITFQLGCEPKLRVYENELALHVTEDQNKFGELKSLDY